LSPKKKIPVIAAGGIFYGGDIAKYLSLGASGVQMATRFVTTDECDADIRFKQAYLNCEEKDLVIIKSPVGMPGRAIRNKFLDEVETGKMNPTECPYFCLHSCQQERSPYCIANALINAQKGEFEYGYVFAGAKAHLCKEIIPVSELFNRLNQEYSEATKNRK
jgi:NAD(P)H-dependent flavin oxidoreductase YrpB (nitropropane dioxygenase family)